MTTLKANMLTMSGEKKPKTVQIILGANPATKKIASADPDADSRDPVAVA